MGDAIYQFLSRFGFMDPIHPTMVHMPMGLVVGALIFGICAPIFWRPLMDTARHCAILSFLFLFPTVILGLLDWYHYYNGALLFYFKMKFILAGSLCILLAVAIVLGNKGDSRMAATLFVYVLCFLAVVGLGYCGGRLVFGGSSVHASRGYQAGANIFNANCNSCHAGGGNIIKPDLPLKGAPQLKDFGTFLVFIRNPLMPDGSKGPMPPFGPERVSEEQAKQLYEYVVNLPGREARQ